MALVDRDHVRELLESPEPDTTLILVDGTCRVVPADQVEGLTVISRRELQDQFAGEEMSGEMSGERLDQLAQRLDTVVRDLGA
ncbi:hypothetical protein [Streptosporangium sp. LJ11]|uniref:hypothetical protein n=1 Tax=Streptosporangium sp. LJ11 TaxID=3436927 RepID=UPI003F7B26A9